MLYVFYIVSSLSSAQKSGGFLRRFGLKMGIRFAKSHIMVLGFAHFGQGSGMVFEGTTEWI